MKQILVSILVLFLTACAGTQVKPEDRAIVKSGV